MEITRASSRRELLALGYTDHDIRRSLKQGAVRYLAPGVLAPAGLFDGSPEERHRQLALMWARHNANPHRALSGVSAAAVLGLPVWGLDVRRVVAVDWGRAPGTRTSSRLHLVSDRRPPAVVDTDGVPVTAAARTVVDVARSGARIPAIALGDSALHQGLCTRDDLAGELDLVVGMTGAARARTVVASLDGRAESVLESRSRIELADAGLPRPELQVELFDRLGRFIARVDMYWQKERVVGEADGNLKYRGSDARAAILREKERTDRIHDLGYRVTRWGWKHLTPPTLLTSQLRTALAIDPANVNPPRP
ncbi:hypothetical protein GII30_21075 [Gordonia amarae]|uniref:Uncharacterized protein n=1 Tax=Gordonia amarae TaxID=36821 RepID=A0A857KQ11_9ACTN|nr:hypothetical protein [Gordonia amarae]MCS3880936.1 very-short-patch-repair endonuclease [Gordonia amarae]QHN19185.1 hypothetical protein GII35_21370 [Gordonia amarae]QHN23661.1 hypothetical protein GII34_20870 [Gordonia amarae]QHN32573.1 hypothetical protein GII32_21200 [Gordonia amarae]QHN41321.1 hypothetical protein GII30_21075 [Gordonia amarae]